jgi:hypothetical protein
VPREVQRLAAQTLRGKRIGLAKALARLADDPCHPSHYRIEGVLHPKVCGLHLARGWRLAFSFLDEDPNGHHGTVAVLFIGEKEPARPRRTAPMWQLVHELFGERHAEGGGQHEPCCAEGQPRVSEREVIELMERLRRLSQRR